MGGRFLSSPRPPSCWPLGPSPRPLSHGKAEEQWRVLLRDSPRHGAHGEPAGATGLRLHKQDIPGPGAAPGDFNSRGGAARPGQEQPGCWEGGHPESLSEAVPALPGLLMLESHSPRDSKWRVRLLRPPGAAGDEWTEASCTQPLLLLPPPPSLSLLLLLRPRPRAH